MARSAIEVKHEIDVTPTLETVDDEALKGKHFPTKAKRILEEAEGY